ncbi:MAG: hypothetical protein H6974_10890 [Gammaproteobacteria bacterium]|nr:hypothetical protein [Gammaproteobacteria bacterium]
MTDGSNSAVLYRSALEIPYDLRFIPLVQSFSNELVRMAGGEMHEAVSLASALDEVLSFVIDAYPDDHMAEFIQIEFQLGEASVVTLSIRNTGPPIHPERIPRYDPGSPESQIDGLWFYLAREFVDELQFINRGMDGWLIVLSQKLGRISFESHTCRTPTPMAKAPDFSFRLAEPADAAALIDLAYNTYRYSYTDADFYDETQLRSALASDNMQCLILTAGDMIVGQIAIFRSPEEPACAYVGGLMISTEYRHSKATFVMTEKLKAYTERNPLDLDLYWGCSVTAHPLSQKLVARIDAHPLALLLMVGPPVTYKGMALTSQERETYVHYHRLNKPNRLQTLYLPADHHDVMAGLLAQVKCDAKLSAATAPPSGEGIRFVTHEFPNDRLAHLRLEVLGRNWATELRQRMFGLRSRGIDSIVVHIAAWQPLPADIDTTLGNLNAVFCGVSAISVQEYFLVYCAPIGRVDFDTLKLADPLAVRLKEHVRRRYEDILGV